MSDKRFLQLSAFFPEPVTIINKIIKNICYESGSSSSPLEISASNYSSSESDLRWAKISFVASGNTPSTGSEYESPSNLLNFSMIVALLAEKGILTVTTHGISKPPCTSGDLLWWVSVTQQDTVAPRLIIKLQIWKPHEVSVPQSIVAEFARAGTW